MGLCQNPPVRWVLRPFLNLQPTPARGGIVLSHYRKTPPSPALWGRAMSVGVLRGATRTETPNIGVRGGGVRRLRGLFSASGAENSSCEVIRRRCRRRHDQGHRCLRR